MAHIPFSDPAWKTTFPFLVEPCADEWVVGLLLHCDEANHWGSGTALTHSCRRNEKTANSDWTFLAPSGFASVQLVWQSNVCSLARWSCHISPSVHSTIWCWSPPAFVGRRYDLFRSKLRYFDASSVAWTGLNCPRKRLTRHVSRSKRNCSG